MKVLTVLGVVFVGIVSLACASSSGSPEPTVSPTVVGAAASPTPTPGAEAEVAGPPNIRVGQVSGLEFTDECRRILAEPAAHSICSVHDCYYFGTGDVYELIPTFDTCEELVAFVANPCEVHRGQALTAIWYNKLLECPLGLYDLEPAAWDQVGLWLQWETRQREQWCAGAPASGFSANTSNCMATGLKTWP